MARTKLYYELPRQVGDLSLEASETRLDQALQKSIRRQLVADVPVGAFLSGGLDSSAIVALAQRHRDQPITCYCIDYSEVEARKEGLTRDAPFAERVARHVGADLRVLMATPFRVDDLSEMVEILDEPLAYAAPLYVGQIARAAREAGVRVLLSGAGGDDLLTGYRRRDRNFNRGRSTTRRTYGAIPYLASAAGAGSAIGAPSHGSAEHTPTVQAARHRSVARRAVSTQRSRGAGLTMLAVAERTDHQRSTKHRAVRSQQKPALGAT